MQILNEWLIEELGQTCKSLCHLSKNFKAKLK